MSLSVTMEYHWVIIPPIEKDEIYSAIIYAIYESDGLETASDSLTTLLTAFINIYLIAATLGRRDTLSRHRV